MGAMISRDDSVTHIQMSALLRTLHRRCRRAMVRKWYASAFAQARLAFAVTASDPCGWETSVRSGCRPSGGAACTHHLMSHEDDLDPNQGIERTASTVWAVAYMHEQLEKLPESSSL